ncbi:MAG: tetratricopeptide repeat protein [Chloroflexota bacterium]
MKIIICIGITLFILLFPHTSVMAADLVQDVSTEKAEKHLREGLALYQSGELAKALIEFEAAHQIYSEGDSLIWQLVANTFVQGTRDQLASGALQTDEAVSDSEENVVPLDDQKDDTSQTDTSQSDATDEADPILQLQQIYDEARALEGNKKYQEAVDTYLAALVVAEELGDPVSLARIWENIGSSYGAIEAYDQAIEAFDKALVIWGELERSASLISTLRQKAVVYETTEQMQLANESYQDALALLAEVDDSAALAFVQSGLGRTYRVLGELELALDAFKSAEALWLEEDELGQAAAILRDTAGIYKEIGEDQNAIKAYERALELTQALEDIRASATLLMTIADYHWSLEEYREALQAYLDSADLWAAQGRVRSQVRSLYGAARSYGNLNEANSALLTYQKAVDAARQAEMPALEADALEEVGNTYNFLEQYDDALDALDQAEALAEANSELNLLVSIYGKKAVAYKGQEKSDFAIEAYQAALELLSEQGNDDKYARQLEVLADYYQRDLDRDRDALTVYLEAADIWATLERPDRQIRMLNRAAGAYSQLGDNSSAISTLIQSLEVARATANAGLIADALVALGDGYLFVEQFPDAISRYKEAEQLVREEGDPKALASIFTDLANAYRKTEQVDEAVEAYQDALAVMKDGGDESTRGRLLETLADYYQRDLKRTADALPLYQEAAATWDALGRTDRQLQMMGRIASAYSQLEDNDSAIATLISAVDLAHSTDDPETVADALVNLGDAYLFVEQNETAIATLKEAEQIVRTSEDPQALASILTDLANAYRKMEQVDAALQAFQDALTIVEEEGDDAKRVRLLETLADYYQRDLKRPQDAIPAYEEAAEIWGSLGEVERQLRGLSRVATAYSQLEDTNASIQTLTQALDVARSTSDSTFVADGLVALGNGYLSIERNQEAILAFTEAAELIEGVGEPETVANVLRNKGSAHLALAEYDAALATYQKALTVLDGSGNEKQRAQLLEAVADIYQRHLSQDDQAIATYREAADLWAILGEPKRQIRMLSRLVSLYGQLNDGAAAIETTNEAIEVARTIEDIKTEADLVDGLGDSLRNLKRYNEAVAAYRQESALWLSQGNDSQVVRSEIDIARTYKDAGLGASILPAYFRALEAASRSGDNELIATVRDSIGSHYLSLQDYENALANFQSALGNWQQTERVDRVASTLSNIGSVQATTDNMEGAFAVYGQAINAANQSENANLEANLWRTLGGLYNRAQQYDNAVNAYQRAANLWGQSGNFERVELAQKGIWSIYTRQKLYAESLPYSPIPVGISEPTIGSVVNGKVNIMGLAEHEIFKRWQLDLLPHGDQNQAIYVGRGWSPSWGRIFTLDTTPYPNGPYSLRLRVIREGANYDEYFTDFVIQNDASTVNQVQNGIESPTQGQSVFGNFNVTGTADDSDFLKWELDLLINGDANQAIHLQTGKRPAGGRLLNVDSRNYPNGRHTLRLRVVHSDTNYDEFFVDFEINN